MIRLIDVKKTYPTRFGQNRVLDGVNFELHMGERLGILGRNGAGKSTMVRLISGAEYPTSGEIERTISVSWPLAFGGAFQPMLTGRDNVRFISRLYGHDFETNLEFVENFAELGAYLSEPVINYSSGMRARLAFAMSMITEFDCFLIDEIAAVGDARFHSRCNYELFERRADRAMVIVSHDSSYIRDHCTRWAVLHEGKLELFDDFDPAYSSFKELIGVSEITKSEVVESVGRVDLISSTRFKAMSDDRFQAIALEGDWGRDEGRWAESAEAYRKALQLYPYHSAYWVQFGHVLKEIPKFPEAEIAYRTAFALGEPTHDVISFLKFVVEAQGLSYDVLRCHPHVNSPAQASSPGAPDIQLLSRLIWPGFDLNEEAILELLRYAPSYDSLIARMVRDEKFVTANIAWGNEAISEGASHNISMLAKSPSVTKHTDSEDLSTLVKLLFPQEYDISGYSGLGFGANVYPFLMMVKAGRFVNWPETSLALSEVIGN